MSSALVRRVVVGFVAVCTLLLAACDDTPDKAETDTSKQTDSGKAASDQDQSDAAKAADALLGQMNKPWTGDYPGMVERRLVRVLLPYSKSFFFIDKGQKKGINYEFLTRFDKFLNKGSTVKKPKKGGKHIKIRLVMIPTPREELLTRLAEGRGDLVVGNLTITDERRELVDFSDPWLKDIQEFIVTSASAPDIASADSLSGMTVHVRRSSSYWESMQALNERLKAAGSDPVKIVETDPYLEDEDLLEMVNADALPAIVVDSHKAKFWAGVFENIKLHPEAAVRTGGQIAWAFRKDSPELASKVNAFIKTIAADTRIGSSIFAAYLKQKSWLKKLNTEKDRAKLREMGDLFRKYGEEYDINWLILAAKAYQESRFDNSVKGPTGAVGVMQIKPSTAASPDVGIKDVRNLENNIHAGTKYTRFLMDKYYADMADDRLNQTLMAFAGYNAGPNRIAGLRKKAKERGLDDSKWFNNVEWVVADSIGAITVNYVSNIFKYFIIYSSVYEQRKLKKEARSQ